MPGNQLIYSALLCMHRLKKFAMTWQVLETVLELLLTEHGQLDPAYCCLQPLEQRRQNVLYMLGHHLAHPSNAAITAPLLERAAKIGPPAVRLLRILCARLFSGDKYLQQKRIARGAYAEVRASRQCTPASCFSSSHTAMLAGRITQTNALHISHLLSRLHP